MRGYVSLPCYCCTERVVTLDYNCHSNCEKFSQYEKENKEAANEERKQRSVNNDFVHVRIEKRIEYKKKKNKLRRR